MQCGVAPLLGSIRIEPTYWPAAGIANNTGGTCLTGTGWLNIMRRPCSTAYPNLVFADFGGITARW